MVLKKKEERKGWKKLSVPDLENMGSE